MILKTRQLADLAYLTVQAQRQGQSRSRFPEEMTEEKQRQQQTRWPFASLEDDEGTGGRMGVRMLSSGG
jgi:hypothetical protein